MKKFNFMGYCDENGATVGTTTEKIHAHIKKKVRKLFEKNMVKSNESAAAKLCIIYEKEMGTGKITGKLLILLKIIVRISIL